MRQIADYPAVRQLGTGSGGQTWLCTASPRLDITAAQVAVKILEQPVGEQQLQLVADELAVYAAVTSPYLVTAYDVGLWNGHVYIAKEYCPLGSLAEVSAVAGRAAVQAVAGAARGVHALHEVGIAHRSIKPSNIMRSTESGKADDLGMLHLLSPGQTVTGAGVAGAIEFMAPGLLRGEQPSRASDIWSLGATLHHMLSGDSLYGGAPSDGGLSSLRHVLATTPQLSVAVPRVWTDIVRRCLAPDPADRYPTAQALAEAIGDQVDKPVGA
jgi:eukaryotic-like serine/threonine-protein kinase